MDTLPVKRVVGAVVGVSTNVLDPDDRAFDVDGNGYVERDEVFAATPPEGAQLDPAELRKRQEQGWKTLVAIGESAETAMIADAFEKVVPHSGIAARLIRPMIDLAVSPGATHASAVARGTQRIFSAGAALGTARLAGGISIAKSAMLMAALRPSKAEVASVLANAAGEAIYESGAWVASGIVGGVVGTGVSTVTTPVGGAVAGVATTIATKEFVLDPTRNFIMQTAYSWYRGDVSKR